MTATSRAGGAAAYSQAEYTITHTLDERGLLSEQAAPPARTWSDVIDELLSIRNLPDDWDGQGSEAPNPAIVQAALNIALSFRSTPMPPADRAIAGVSGSVIFEWFAPGNYMEIEVTAPDHAEGRWVRKEAGTTEEFTLSCRS